MKIFGLNDKIEIQGKLFRVYKIERKGIYVQPIDQGLGMRWIAQVNVNEQFDLGNLKVLS